MAHHLMIRSLEWLLWSLCAGPRHQKIVAIGFGEQIKEVIGRYPANFFKADTLDFRKFSRCMCNITWFIWLSALWHRGQIRRISLNQQAIKWHVFQSRTDFLGRIKRNNT